MVSLGFNQDQGFCLFDPKNTRPLPGLGSLPPTAAPSVAEGADKASLSNDSVKRIRKPYTVRNSRESWTEEEHDKFLEALQLFDRDWKKIKAFVGSKTVIQIRSHAQKYFLKVQRYGGGEHIPPPRPKRKARHPYPKASEPAKVISQADGRHQSEPHYSHRQEPSFMLDHPMKNSTSSSWGFNSVPLVNVPQVTQDDIAGQTSAHDVCVNSKDESSLRSRKAGVNSNRGGDHTKPTRVVPDFGIIYRFIGSVFDPNANGHLERLKQMELVDVETAIYFMQNLSINLRSPEFQNELCLTLVNFVAPLVICLIPVQLVALVISSDQSRWTQRIWRL